MDKLLYSLTYSEAFLFTELFPLKSSDMTRLKSLSSKDFRNLAGNPKGLSKDETQILVSITDLMATFFFSGFNYGIGNIRFDLLRRICVDLSY